MERKEKKNERTSSKDARAAAVIGDAQNNHYGRGEVTPEGMRVFDLSLLLLLLLLLLCLLLLLIIVY